MTEDQRFEFDQEFIRLVIMFQNVFSLEEEVIAVMREEYWEGLKELDLEEISDLFNEIKLNCERWFPTLAEMRSMAGLRGGMDNREHRKAIAANLFDQLTTGTTGMLEAIEPEGQLTPDGRMLTGFYKLPKKFNSSVLGDTNSLQRAVFMQMGGTYFFNKLERGDSREMNRARKQWVEIYDELYLKQQRIQRKLIGQGLSHDESKGFLRDNGFGDILGDFRKRKNGHNPDKEQPE